MNLKSLRLKCLIQIISSVSRSRVLVPRRRAARPPKPAQRTLARVRVGRSSMATGVARIVYSLSASQRLNRRSRRSRWVDSDSRRRSPNLQRADSVSHRSRSKRRRSSNHRRAGSANRWYSSSNSSPRPSGEHLCDHNLRRSGERLHDHNSQIRPTWRAATTTEKLPRALRSDDASRSRRTRETRTRPTSKRRSR